MMGSDEKPKLRCCKTIFGGGWNRSGCSKPAKYTVDGKHYCGTHNPAAEAARNAKSEAKYKAQSEARDAEWKAKDIAALKAKHFDAIFTCAKMLAHHDTELAKAIKTYERALARLEKPHAH